MPDTISWSTDLTRYQERQTHPFEMTPVPHHESTSGCIAVICIGFETIMKQHLFSIWLFQLNELFANSRAAEEQALSLCLLSDLSSRVLCKMMPSFFLLYTCTFDPSRSLSRTHLFLLSDLSSFCAVQNRDVNFVLISKTQVVQTVNWQLVRDEWSTLGLTRSG